MPSNKELHLARKNIGLDPRRLYVPLVPSAAQVTSPFGKEDEE
jgi:hypothetical protein